MNMYDWGFFFENGEKANFIAPFGPVNEERPGSAAFLDSLEGEWMDKLYEFYPALKDGLKEVEDWCFAMVLVNPPREATPEEEEWLENR